MGAKNHGADFLMGNVLSKAKGPKLTSNEEPPTKEEIDAALESLGSSGGALAESITRVDDALKRLANCGLRGPGFVTMVHSQCQPIRTPGGRSMIPPREYVEEVLRAMFAVPEGFLKS